VRHLPLRHRKHWHSFDRGNIPTIEMFSRVVVAVTLLLAVSGSLFGKAISISAVDLAAQLATSGKTPLVLDVRGLEAHRKGTIPGAVHVGTNPDEFQPPVAEVPIVLVLPEPYDPTYLRAWTTRLEDAGLSVRWLNGGVPAWRAAGFALASPKHEYSKPGTVPFIVPRGLCEMREPAQEFK